MDAKDISNVDADFKWVAFVKLLISFDLYVIENIFSFSEWYMKICSRKISILYLAL